MKDFYTNGSLEIDNNATERTVKLFVIGRKNWLFSNTPKCAGSSAILYSTIETPKANGLAVEKYLIYLFDVLSKTENRDLEFSILLIFQIQKVICNFTQQLLFSYWAYFSITLF